MKVVIYDGDQIIKELDLEGSVDELEAKLTAEPVTLEVTDDNGETLEVEVLAAPTMKEFVEGLFKARKSTEPKEADEDESEQDEDEDEDKDDEAFKQLLALLRREKEEKAETVTKETIRNIVKEIVKEVLAETSAKEPEPETVKEKQVVKAWKGERVAKDFGGVIAHQQQTAEPNEPLSQFQKAFLNRLLGNK